MTASPDELMKSYEVIRSIVMRHSQYDAARILTLNLATCITEGSQQDEAQAIALFPIQSLTSCTSTAGILPLSTFDGRGGCTCVLPFSSALQQ